MMPEKISAFYEQIVKVHYKVLLLVLHVVTREIFNNTNKRNKLRVLLFNYLTNGDLFICSTTQDGVQCRFFWKAAGIFLNIETGTDLMDGIHGIKSIQNGKLFGKTNGSCKLPYQFAALLMKCPPFDSLAAFIHNLCCSSKHFRCRTPCKREQ